MEWLGVAMIVESLGDFQRWNGAGGHVR